MSLFFLSSLFLLAKKERGWWCGVQRGRFCQMRDDQNVFFRNMNTLFFGEEHLAIAEKKEKQKDVKCKCYRDTSKGSLVLLKPC